ncbi:tRNA epoxyqueuosine(34) reductase QueG [bacterium]|nr:tRNA epoxyqueuosine(34) reductase QueG [bacterium]
MSDATQPASSLSLSPNPSELAELIKQAARHLGFDFASVAPYEPPPHADTFPDWIANDYHGTMAWLAKHPDRRMDPRVQWPQGKSVLSVGMSYHQPRPMDAPDPADPSRGRFASYAWGFDYHDLILPRLKALGKAIDYLAGRVVNARAYVDTGPILERPLAAAGGAGFIGKHTLLIHWKHGSYFLLGELLLDLELPSDPARKPLFGCRDCHSCGTSCPTGALDTPYLNRANRCISYLTIEHRGILPRNLRSELRNWVFGCDICQQACPYNTRGLLPTREPWFEPRIPDWGAPPLLELIALDDDQFGAMFKGSPVKRTKRRGLLRNVAVALGNWGSDEAIPALKRVMEDEPEPLIRAHAAWALGQLSEYPAVRVVLDRAFKHETDEIVLEEINTSLDHGIHGINGTTEKN